MSPTPAPPPRAALIALTPEARAALGAPAVDLDHFPFRVGRDSRGARRTSAQVIMERRRTTSPPNNDLYLREDGQPFNVSREHFQIEHNGSSFILVDRQSTCGTIVEGTVVGGRNEGGAVALRDADVIIPGTSTSRFAFKFRLR